MKHSAPNREARPGLEAAPTILSTENRARGTSWMNWKNKRHEAEWEPREVAIAPGTSTQCTPSASMRGDLLWSRHSAEHRDTQRKKKKKPSPQVAHRIDAPREISKYHKV